MSEFSKHEIPDHQWWAARALALILLAVCITISCATRPTTFDLGRSLHHQNNSIEIVVTLSDTLLELSDLLFYDTLSTEACHLASDGYYYDSSNQRRLSWNGSRPGSIVMPVDQNLLGPTIHCTVYNKGDAPLVVPCFACGPVWLFNRWSESGMFMRLSRGGSEFDTYTLPPLTAEPSCEGVVFDTIPAADSIVYPVDIDVFLCAFQGIKTHGFSDGQYAVYVVLRNPCWFESADLPVVWLGSAESNRVSFRIVDSRE